MKRKRNKKGGKGKGTDRKKGREGNKEEGRGRREEQKERNVKEGGKEGRKK